MENIVLITVRNKNDIKYDDVEIEKFNHYDEKHQEFLQNFKPNVRICLNDNTIFSSPVILSEEDASYFKTLNNDEKLQYFIDNPKKFDAKYCKNIVNSNEKLKKLFDTQNFLHIKDSNIYFYDCINASDTKYWDEIKRLLDMIKLPNANTSIPVYLVLHIGDNYLLNITDASFFYKDDFPNSANWEKTDNDSEHWNQVIKKLNGYSIEIVTAFHHSDSNKIYTEIIKNQKIWKECNTNKTAFITKAIKDYYYKDDFRDSILAINDKYYHIINGKEENNPKWDKLLNEININCISSNQSNNYIILYATEHCFKLNDFFLALANFQLQGCNISKYQSFIEKKNLVNNQYHNYIDTPRSLNPKFDSNNFSTDIKPIIIYGTKALTKLQEEKQEKYDRRINYLDSSIWLQYVSNQEEFNKAKENVAKWKELYNTINAKEIVEFKARQLKNSFLREINENASHAQNVVPFLFHSESKMKELTVEKIDNDPEKSELKKLQKKGNLEWRFLLIDDHATETLAKKEKCISKCEIIKNILWECGFVCKCSDKDKQQKCPNAQDYTTIDNKLTIYFECVTEKNDDSIDKFQKNKYDLILMDYLLEKTKDGRNYAHTILRDIQKHFENPTEKSEWKKIAGPNGSFHFFFISAFSNALNERMLAEGLDFHETYWHISRGACPTTTPHLFSYYLLKTLNRQIEQMSDNKDADIVTLLDLLANIYDNSTITPREQAINKYNSLLKMRSRYDDLKYDACLDINKKKIEDKEIKQHKSKLVNSLFLDISFYDNAFWEHTMHLVYLTAFGTIRQWHDMWSEFMLIKPILQKASQDDKCKEKAEKVIKKIDEYITKLQEQSSR